MKATLQCQIAEGSGPINTALNAINRGPARQRARPHSAITSSQPAYQCCGLLLRSMARPSVTAPSAKPAKKAAMVASTASASWPSTAPNWLVHTHCQPRAAAPDKPINSSDAGPRPAA